MHKNSKSAGTLMGLGLPDRILRVLNRSNLYMVDDVTTLAISKLENLPGLGDKSRGILIDVIVSKVSNLNDVDHPAFCASRDFMRAFRPQGVSGPESLDDYIEALEVELGRAKRFSESLSAVQPVTAVTA